MAIALGWSMSNGLGWTKVQFVAFATLVKLFEGKSRHQLYIVIALGAHQKLMPKCWDLAILCGRQQQRWNQLLYPLRMRMG